MFCALRSCSSGESSSSEVAGMTTSTPLIGQNFRYFRRSLRKEPHSAWSGAASS